MKEEIFSYSSLTSCRSATSKLKPHPFFIIKKFLRKDIIDICIAVTVEFVEVLVPSLTAMAIIGGTQPLIQSEND